MICREATKGIPDMAERVFSGDYWDCKEKGIVCCGQELFSSKTTFDSGTGWPSFWQPLSEESIDTEIENWNDSKI
jgi:peptide-methionine (R)-S-oxide reductase